MGKLFRTTLLLYMILAPIVGASQENSEENISAFNFNATYVGEVVSNFHGGIKTGTAYLGFTNVTAGVDTKAANWWKDGSFFLNIGNTHGGEPSSNLVGDFQGVSNIEAGNHTFLYELWYSQKIGMVGITLGLQDLNANFATSENGALFTNSSFGIQSSISDNVSVPIFPLTALGINVRWTFSENTVLETAIFDGTPDDFANNPYNIKWNLSEDQGYLAIAEMQFNKGFRTNKMGSYKLGFYYHQHKNNVDELQKNGGLYLIADQQISDRLSLFSQIGLSPRNKNNHNHFYGLGFNYTILNQKRPSDLFGMALAYAGIDENTIGSETAIELTYKFQINKLVYLRPDIQYVINPAGTGKQLQNALVGFIRFGIEL